MKTILVVLTEEDYRFITEYDPERERSASRRDLVAVLEDIAAWVQQGRITP